MLIVPVFFESNSEQYENENQEISVNFACIFIMIYAGLFYTILALDRWMRTPLAQLH